MTSRGPFQPKPFYDTLMLLIQHNVKNKQYVLPIVHGNVYFLIFYVVKKIISLHYIIVTITFFIYLFFFLNHKYIFTTASPLLKLIKRGKKQNSSGPLELSMPGIWKKTLSFCQGKTSVSFIFLFFCKLSLDSYRKKYNKS